MSDSKTEDAGFVLNLSEDEDKKKRNDTVNTESPDVKTNSSFIEDSDTSPSCAFKLKNKSKFLKKQTLFSKSHNSSPKSVDIKQKLGHDNLHFSSIFKSNPEIPHLNVCKQKAKSEPLFSTKTFDDLDLHPHLVSCLKSRLEAVRLTKVQESSIPILLQGQDALIKSCTGSGKTLAYAVPIVQKLQEMNPKVQRSDGVYALVIVPTRELALQCFECFSKLTKAFTWIVPGYLIGGEKKKSEKARLRKGINILISTPGRLLDHMEHTSCLSLSKILWLVIDEADKLLEQGFEEAVTKIISQCNENRHSILLSATLSKGVENLAGMSLSDPVHIDVGINASKESGKFENLVVPTNLKQYIVVVPSKLRLAVISGFIIDNCLKGGFKALIFMCSQSSVNFHYSLFSSVLATLLQAREKKCKFYRLHGNMKQEERTEIFNSFKSAKEGVLLCTDVAARGLDLLHVDWIVQYSAPSSAEIYVHRVGRTARIGMKGNSLLFLLPSESNFAHLLGQHKISYDEIPASKFLQSILLVNEVLSPKNKTTAEECATALHSKYENEVYSESVLHDEAKEAFASYVQSYASYPKNIRHVLPFKALHLGHVAKSFCLREAPSALGCNIPNAERPKQRKLTTKPQKRKMQVVISEYDSGLSALTHDFGRKPKRKKS